VWIEFQHVAGEIWRFRRVAQRLRARLSSTESELLAEPVSFGLPESDSMVSLQALAPPAGAPHGRDRGSGLVSADTSLAPLRAIVRFGREPAPAPASAPSSRPSSLVSFGPLSRFPPGAERGHAPHDRPHVDGRSSLHVSADRVETLRAPIGR
jgi:hypothetical protein